jgi:hypothetical protein
MHTLDSFTSSYEGTGEGRSPNGGSAGDQYPGSVVKGISGFGDGQEVANDEGGGFGHGTVLHNDSGGGRGL